MYIFNRTLSQTELVKKLSTVMPKSEYLTLTTQIVSMADNDPNRARGQFLNLMG